MRVRANHRLARYAEALHVRRMRNSVTRFGKPQTETTSSRAKEQMVLGVALVGLEQVVIDVLHADLGVRPV
jgi:hypothetical protein